MEIKHTKGEWELQNHHSERISIHVGDYKAICDVWGKSVSSVTNSEMESNAKLIAQSPIMYDFLLEVIRDFESDYVSNGKIVDNPRECYVMQYERAKKIIETINL